MVQNPCDHDTSGSCTLSGDVAKASPNPLLLDRYACYVDMEE